MSALVGVALMLGACADDDGSEPTASESTIDSASPSTNEATGSDSMPDTTSPDPVPGERPANTLELNPSKTSVAAPPTTEGDPIGFDASLYAGQVEAGLAPFIEVAAVDLARRLDVDRSAITTISATLVTWSDSSMGCPLPGMQYAQALQDGSLIELAAEVTVYRYHSGGDRQPFLCDRPLATPPVSRDAADS